MFSLWFKIKGAAKDVDESRVADPYSFETNPDTAF
jgi:hypothetical protein